MRESSPRFSSSLNLADYFLFDRLREGRGDRVALRFGDRQYTYRDVADRVAALVRYLGDIGVKPEQRMLIVLPDMPTFAWSIFAGFAAGAVVAMGNPNAPDEDLEYLLEYTRAAAVVTTLEVARRLLPALRASSHVLQLLLCPDVTTLEDPESSLDIDLDFARAMPLSQAIAQGRKLERERPSTHRDDVCMWLFTSGSTGRPKAAMHTHRDFAFNTEVYAKKTLGYREDDVTVSVPRLFFGYATGTNLFFPFAVGATAALFSERPTAQTLLAAVARYRPSIVTNVPTMMSKILEFDRDQGESLDMTGVRFHLSAGEALPPALLERFSQRFSAQVLDGIGSAEMFHIYCSNRPGDVKAGSLGRAVTGYELRVLPRDASSPGVAPVPPGELGVLWVKGDSVALGYFQDRDSSWATFHGHWCRTGDLFRCDKDGYFWFAGRDDELFKVGGIWVSPVEVETCLMTHPSVSLAAIVPFETAGLTKPKAYVVLRPGVEAVTEDELQKHCQAILSKHKYPRSVVFVEDLPKNDRGKVDKKALKAHG